jgi:hypothetical protein
MTAVKRNAKLLNSYNNQKTEMTTITQGENTPPMDIDKILIIQRFFRDFKKRQRASKYVISQQNHMIEYEIEPDYQTILTSYSKKNMTINESFHSDTDESKK